MIFKPQQEDEYHASGFISAGNCKYIKTTWIKGAAADDHADRQYAPFSDREQVINRSTVARTLESLVLYTEVGDLLDFCVVEGGSANKKKYYIENHKIG